MPLRVHVWEKGGLLSEGSLLKPMRSLWANEFVTLGSIKLIALLASPQEQSWQDQPTTNSA